MHKIEIPNKNPMVYVLWLMHHRFYLRDIVKIAIRRLNVSSILIPIQPKFFI